ncbi:hypothetical protein [Gemmatimonas sp.]|uniref:hypothetical protein n=1 Tax=Gemmatimonas sp. TaxID=1962908 RepID=UPI003562BC53
MRRVMASLTLDLNRSVHQLNTRPLKTPGSATPAAMRSGRVAPTDRFRRRNYFSGTQLGTVFPAFFLLPTRSYPSQHGSAAFFDTPFFDAAFLGEAFFLDAAFRGAAVLTGVMSVSQDGTDSR